MKLVRIVHHIKFFDEFLAWLIIVWIRVFIWQTAVKTCVCICVCVCMFIDNGKSPGTY